MKIAGTKLVSLCDGIEGGIGSLKVGKTYEDEEYRLPIDTLVVGLAKEDDEDDEFGQIGGKIAISSI